ncbi:hypothetical protein I4F81_012124 [Pyropia yezoensis]|uniref:Uncharacterized protein n=1 Tax=Pyropia yezoensis TaxID=2788 RepID=A0ACC3CHK6_PYRYE|nr:hypothetical protein I4F81_012124 [Neopyropia yezoensis]
MSPDEPASRSNAASTGIVSLTNASPPSSASTLTRASPPPRKAASSWQCPSRTPRTAPRLAPARPLRRRWRQAALHPRPAFSSVPAVAAAATAGSGITRSRGTGGTRMAGEKLAATGARTARTLPGRF